MNEINIVSSDARYEALDEIFRANGYFSRLCTSENIGSPDVLILPIKSALNDEEFSKIFLGLKKSTLVFCGEALRARKFFGGEIINYSQDESFLDKNAYITAECALGIVINELGKTISGSNHAVIGYGRIGKHLSNILKRLGARVSVFARREESRQEAILNGCRIISIDEIADDFDVIYNTVPQRIISKEESDKMPRKTLVYDLASLPGGFEDEDFPKRALALPGKMMPTSAADAIFNFVKEYISNERN